MVYGCTQARVRSNVYVSGKRFSTELSLHCDVNIRFAVTRHWTSHVTVWQLLPYILDNAVATCRRKHGAHKSGGGI